MNILDKGTNDDTVVILCLTIIILLTAGEPDLLGAIIRSLPRN